MITGAVVIGGGGTAGHVLPGLSVARALVASGRAPSEITFVGAARGQESELVPAAGFEVVLLPGRGIQRKLTVDNVASAWGILRAVVSCIALFGRTRPAVVVSAPELGSATAVALYPAPQGLPLYHALPEQQPVPVHPPLAP